ncbi:hypothetical protein KZX50_26110 [Bacillus infantis]|uniref:hypothetical protein n=1 Tax=Bacillus infantis TaxID=324767 RepID=UPI000B9C38AD|nr:hypothetical protein [Bacillus infantis]MCK6208886.1 hypothetical protein [Bacillus infantis]OXT16601.1 hypothetical protein B9K06_14320 [Bacillus sp. OG2]
MTFNKKYYLGYLVFVIALAIVYFTVPREYGFYALMALSILFGVFQFFIIPKKNTNEKNNTSP